MSRQSNKNNLYSLSKTLLGVCIALNIVVIIFISMIAFIILHEQDVTYWFLIANFLFFTTAIYDYFVIKYMREFY